MDGFRQIITGITRSWHTHEDSLLDQVWINCPQKVVSHGNYKSGTSDHNLVTVTIAMKDLKIGGAVRRRRSWKDFDNDRCMRRLKDLDWEDLFSETNPDLANSQLEENILSVLNLEAPMRNFQSRTKYNKLLTTETKECIEVRDNLKEVARATEQ